MNNNLMKSIKINKYDYEKICFFWEKLKSGGGKIIVRLGNCSQHTPKKTLKCTKYILNTYTHIQRYIHEHICRNLYTICSRITC